MAHAGAHGAQHVAATSSVELVLGGVRCPQNQQVGDSET